MNAYEFKLQPNEKLHRRLLACAVAGVIVTIFALVMQPQRAWMNLLLVSYYFVGLALAGALFVAFQYVTGACWSISLRRVPEAFATLVPIGGAGVLGVLLFRPSLYAWTTTGELAGFRRVWLSLAFFRGRAIFYIAAWTAFAYLLVLASRRQDSDRDPRHTRQNRRVSALFLVVFAITFWLASYDWIMSLQPDWYSTIFGMYNFAGLFCSGLAAIALALVYLKRHSSLGMVIHEDHLRDVGKLLFAFSTFWMYLWFSQYMLIWYANLPEETSYYVQRQHGLWAPLFLLNIFLNWVVPFFALMPKVNKGKPGLLARVAIVVLAGRWLDLYLMTAPPFAGATPRIGVWEIGAVLLLVGVAGLTLFRALRKASLVPVNDPFLAESLHYHA